MQFFDEHMAAYLEWPLKGQRPFTGLYAQMN